MTRASYHTLLSLDRYAQIMGINPAHFSGAAHSSLFPSLGQCNDVWRQFNWQGGHIVGREDIAEAIMGAEADLAEFLGYWPAPKFISREVHPFPRHYRRDMFDVGLNSRYDRKSIRTKWAKVISAGRRNLQVIGAATKAVELIYDLALQTATITLPTPAGITAASEYQIKTYFDGTQTPEWEIRPPISVEIGANVVIIFHAWQLIEPALQLAFPTADPFQAIDLTDINNFVDVVDVYREYADYTQHSVEFYWEPRYTSGCPVCNGAGCVACQHTVQCGCLYVRDVHQGIVVPTPAEYDTDEEVWNDQAFDLCYAPDMLRFWYYAGDISDEFLNGYTTDPLSHFWAEIIAWMATARLYRPFCSCVNLNAYITQLQMDVTRSEAEGPAFTVSESDLDNPFGTRKGEVLAWRRVSKLAEKRGKVAVI